MGAADTPSGQGNGNPNGDRTVAIWLRFKSWRLAVGAAIAAVIGVYLYGRNSGSLREMQRQAEKDRETSRKVEDAADDARKRDIGDPVKRLRDSQRLRD